ncbi:MaoC/PaaZ C-terminal domain-containing protein [Alteromonas sp. H39]|uniref:MaoC/PaaZ C-terminal domain-containing protein n=1 Tax=Alteromonas sp. H39 TaxID=3389876 RepID=UPI0039E16074
MFPFGKFVKVAMHKANKAQLTTWLNNNAPIELPHISSSKEFKATQFQSQLVAFNNLHNWDSSFLHPCFVLMLGLEQQVMALSHPASPFSAFGMIQTENCISLTSPVHNGDLTLHCQLAAIRPCARGFLVDIEVSAIQLGRCSFTAVSTYLYKMDLQHTPNEATVYSPMETNSSTSEAQGEAILCFEENVGRKYARISKDFNPIHLYPWSAKLFGYQHPIAHGMHMLALVLSKLAKRISLPEIPTHITNQFIYPASLPCATNLNFSGDLFSNDALSFRLINPKASSRKQTVLAGKITHY